MTTTAYGEFHREFLDLEYELDLFELEVDGVRVWERIRHDVAMGLLADLGICGDVARTAPSLTKYLRSGYLGLRNLAVRNPLFAPEPDVLCYGRGRRVQVGEEWRDIFLDPLHETVGSTSLQIESAWHGAHNRPEQTDAIRYVDFIYYLSQFCHKFGVVDHTFSPVQRRTIERTEDRFGDAFGTNVDVVSHVRREIHRRTIAKPLFDLLLSRLTPDIAVVVVHGTKQTLIDCCHDAGIPVVEIQHGQMSNYSYNYSYQGDRSVVSFPDYLLTFGEAWADAADLPLPSERVIPVGYPYLEAQLDRVPSVEPGEDGTLLFISTCETGHELSQVAVEAATDPALSHGVTYKLHPAECYNWRSEYPWLADSPIDVVDSQDRSLHELFRESTAQVGVCSTAIYEGLAFGLDTYLVELPTVEWLSPLLDNGSATLVETAEELVTELRQPGDRQLDRAQYFEPNAVETLGRTIDRLVNEASIYRRRSSDRHSDR